jgi:hypothetical protein
MYIKINLKIKYNSLGIYEGKYEIQNAMDKRLKL